MPRFLLRFTGYWLVAAALVIAVVDGAKSIAASALVTTPLRESWRMLAAVGGAGEAPAAEPFAAPWPLDIVLAQLAAAPTAAVLAVLGLFFLVIGKRRRRPALGHTFAT